MAKGFINQTRILNKSKNLFAVLNGETELSLKLKHHRWVKHATKEKASSELVKLKL